MSSVDALSLTINPEDHREFDPCDCCGTMTSKVWGYVYAADSCIAVYYVEWTPKHNDSAATFDLIVGPWGDETTAKDRVSVSVAFRNISTGPSFMVVNSEDRPYAKSGLVGKALSREAVLDSSL